MQGKNIALERRAADDLNVRAQPPTIKRQVDIQRVVVRCYLARSRVWPAIDPSFQRAAVRQVLRKSRREGLFNFPQSRPLYSNRKSPMMRISWEISPGDRLHKREVLK